MTGDPRGTVPDQIAWIIARLEGDWSDHPMDRGGPTSRGMTLTGWHEHSGAWITTEQLAALSDEQILAGHADLAARRHGRILLLPDWRVRLAALDFAVNSGAPRATRVLQTVVGAEPDGLIGPKTLAAITAMEPVQVATALTTARQRFLIDLIHRDYTQREFMLGWWDRCTTILEMVQR